MKLSYLKEIYARNKDVKFRDLYFSRKITIIYVEGLCNTTDIENYLIYKLEEAVITQENLMKSNFLDIQVMKENNEDLDLNLFSGKIVIIDQEKYYTLNTIKTPSRNPEQSNIDITITGPKDSFVENLQINVALIRKRLKTEKLKYETFVIGNKSKTTVGLLYMDDVINQSLLNEIKRKIKSIHCDAIVSTSEFRSYLYDKKNNTFPLATYTQRPDYCVSSLLAGKFVILLDNFNTATIGPVTLSFLTDFSDDINEHYLSTILNRIIYFFCFVISIYLMGFVLALYTYNPEQLPITILANMIIMRKGIVLPVHLEIIFATFLFELFRIVGTRLPSGISSTLLVVGGILIGQITIACGLISYDIMFLTALTSICTYAISNNLSVNNLVTFLKWFVFLFSYTLGSYGFILSFIFITIYLTSQKSFGVPITMPFAPLSLKNIPNIFLGRNYILKKKKPYYNQPQEEYNS